MEFFSRVLVEKASIKSFNSSEEHALNNTLLRMALYINCLATSDFGMTGGTYALYPGLVGSPSPASSTTNAEARMARRFRAVLDLRCWPELFRPDIDPRVPAPVLFCLGFVIVIIIINNL